MRTGVEPCFQAVRSCVHSLTEAGFVVPSWTSLAASEEVMFATEAEPHEPKTGWQQKAAQKIHEKFHQVSYWPSSRTQRRPCTPNTDHWRHQWSPQSQPIARPGLSPSCFGFFSADASVCPCPCPHAPADVAAFLIHLAIIVQRALRQGSWVEGAILWNARRHRCAGARVTTNVFIRDLDLVEFRGLDGRRIEVIAVGLTFVPRRPIGHRHNDGVTPPQRRHHEARSCSTPRCGIGTGTEDEGGHIPGIGG